MALVGSLVASLSARTEDFDSGMRRAQTSLKGVQDGVERTKSSVSTLGSTVSSQASTLEGAVGKMRASLVGLAAAVVSVQAVTRAITSSVEAAVKLESLTLSFKAVTGSAQGAAQAMEFVRSESNRLGVGVTELATGYKTLLAASSGTSISLQEIQTLFTGVTEAGRALGLSTDDISGALRPLTQIISQQAVQADELRNEFGSRIPGAMQLLVTASAGAFKSVAELNKAMEDGKLKGEAALIIISNLGVVLRQRFAADAAAAANSTTAAFERFRQTVHDLQVAIGQQLAPAFGEAARALQEFLTLSSKTTQGLLGGESLFLIRQITSAIIGLAGGFILAGKAAAAFASAVALDPKAVVAAEEDIAETFNKILDIQTRLLEGRFAPGPTPSATPPALALRPLPLGGAEGAEKRARGLSETERAANTLARERASIEREIADMLDREQLTERQILARRIDAAGFDGKRKTALLEMFDTARELARLTDLDTQRTRDRLQVTQQLQDRFEDVTLTDRQRLDLQLQALQFDDKKRLQLLDQFDLTQKIRREQEAARDAAEQHASKMAGILQQMQPQRRFRDRAEELVELEKQVALEGGGEFEMAQANVQRLSTTAIEEADRVRELMQRAGEELTGFLTGAFEDFVFRGEFSFRKLAESFTQMVFRILIQSAELDKSLAKLFAKGLELGLTLLGGAASVSSAASGTVEVAGVAATSVISRQHGGMVFPMRPTIVGESGPELILPTVPGVVLTNSQTRQALSESGKTTTVTNHITVNIATPSPESFQQSRGAVSRAILNAITQAQRSL